MVGSVVNCRFIDHEQIILIHLWLITIATAVPHGSLDRSMLSLG